jgi:hypothetical protein
MADRQVHVPEPITQKAVQSVFGSDSLHKRILDGVLLAVPIRRKPRSAVDVDPASLDLEHKKPMPRMDQYEVGFPVAFSAPALRLPGHRLKHPPRLWKPLERAAEATLCRASGRYRLTGQHHRHNGSPVRQGRASTPTSAFSELY